MSTYDLHCHSTCSDGLLAPGEVVARAAARGVNVLALTDHDDVAGIADARSAADAAGITLVAGAELSVSWEGHTIHVVGLHIDPASPGLVRGLAGIRDGRNSRARRMGEALAAAGIPDAYAGAMRYVTSPALVSRTHFARFLVERGYVKEVKDVFDHYLVPGKPGYVPHPWAQLAEAVAWIHEAGGQAVLAHPGRYKVNSADLRHLITAFRDCGGDGIEVLSSSHTRAQFEQFATLARVHGLLASCGSDFHAPGESWLDLGGLPALPEGITAVWTRW